MATQLEINGASLMFDGGLLGAATYVALLTSSGEVSGNGYARISVASNGWTYTTVSSTKRQAANTGAVTFAASTGSWGDVTRIALYDALTAGNKLLEIDLSNNPDEITQSGTVVTIAASAIKIRIPTG